MKHIGVLKPDTLVAILNWVGLPVAFVYFISMFVWPWIVGGSNWDYVQNVWDRWQGLNVGMLAFISSIAAFNIAKFNARKQREREFSAAKAFLPNALSELCNYLNSCASLLEQAWRADPAVNFEADAPQLPESYKEVFGNCIRFAEPDVGEYLANILVKLQINHSRLKSLAEGERGTLSKHNIISYLYGLGELQALVNKLFPFARSMEEFDNRKLEWENFRNAFSIWYTFYDDFRINDEMNIEAFTKRAIERNDE